MSEAALPRSAQADEISAGRSVRALTALGRRRRLPDVLLVEDLADAFGVAPHTIHDWIGAKALPATKIGVRWVTTRTALLVWLREKVRADHAAAKSAEAPRTERKPWVRRYVAEAAPPAPSPRSARGGS